MFELIGDNGLHSLYATKAEAIQAGRDAKVESFEIYDEDDRQIFCERPVPQWA